MPSLFNREPLEHWKASDRESLFASLNKRVKKVLAEHEAPALEAGVRKELDKVLSRREKFDSA